MELNKRHKLKSNFNNLYINFDGLKGGWSGDERKGEMQTHKKENLSQTASIRRC